MLTHEEIMRAVRLEEQTSYRSCISHRKAPERNTRRYRVHLALVDTPDGDVRVERRGYASKLEKNTSSRQRN